MLNSLTPLTRDLENQARVDGASLGSTFFHILLPLFLATTEESYVLVEYLCNLENENGIYHNY